jgi:hypothetical protein
MAAPTVVAASADAQWDVDGNITAGLPAGLIAGDLLVLLVFVRNGSQTINLASTYTLVSADNASVEAATTTEVQAKVAGGSESAPNVVTSQVASQPTGAILIAVRGWSGTIGDLVISTPAGGASATLVAPTINTAVADCLVLRCYLNADDNVISTPPASHSLVFTGSTALGSDAAMHVYSATQASAGATGTASLVVVGADAFMAWTIAIPPATGTTHDAAGTMTATASLTGTASADRVTSVTMSTTAALTGFATVTGSGPAPTERTLVVAAESRTTAVPVESRTTTVPAESRRLTVSR